MNASAPVDFWLRSPPAVEPERRRLLLRLWIILGVLFVAMQVYGFLYLIVEGGVPPTYQTLGEKLRLFAVWFSPGIRWMLLTPVLLITVHLILDRADGWGEVFGPLIAVVIVVWMSEIAADVLLRRVLLDPGAHRSVIARYLTHLLADVGNWTILTFAAFGARAHFYRVAEEARLAHQRRTELTERMKGELLRTDPRILLAKLEEIEGTLHASPRDARRELLMLGDYLRAQLTHTSKGIATIREEIRIWDELARLVGKDLELTSSLDEMIRVPAGGAITAAIHVSDHEFEPGSPRRGTFTSSEQDGAIELRFEGLTEESVKALEKRAKEDRVTVESRVPGEIHLTLPRVDSPSAAPESVVEPVRHGAHLPAVWLATASVIVGTFSTVIARFLSPGRVLSSEYALGMFTDLLDWTVWGAISGYAAWQFAKRKRWQNLIGAGVIVVILIAAHFVVPALIALYQGREILRETLLAGQSWDLALRLGYATMLISWWYYSRELDHSERARRETERLTTDVAELRLRVMRSQIQPHFLLNSLHAVNALISSDPERAAVLARQLRELVRDTSKHLSRGFIPLTVELQLAERYLQVLQTRYGNRLEYTISCDGDLEGVEIPALLTQPILENALVHGVEKTTGACDVTMKVERHGGGVRMSISNPSVFESDVEPLWGVGLTNTLSTLELCYGNESSLDITSNDGRYEVTLVFPRRAGLLSGRQAA